jgi:hypothetical protein
MQECEGPALKSGMGWVTVYHHMSVSSNMVLDTDPFLGLDLVKAKQILSCWQWFRELLERTSRGHIYFDSSFTPRPMSSAHWRQRLPGSNPLPDALNCNDDAFVSFLQVICTSEMRILLMAATQGPDFLFCMPDRTKCILLISVVDDRGWRLHRSCPTAIIRIDVYWRLKV